MLYLIKINLELYTNSKPSTTRAELDKFLKLGGEQVKKINVEIIEQQEK